MGVCGEQRQSGGRIGVRDPMKYGSMGCRWSTGRGANPIWEKKVSPLALQSIAIPSSQYVKGNMLFGL